MLETWRLIKQRYAANAVDGEGTRLHGSRWTSPGRRAVMTSQSRSLAILEVLVSLPAPRFLNAYVFFRIGIPEDVVTDLDAATLPADWRRSPIPPSTQALGDAWLTGASALVLRVPSAVVPDEHNYLINPGHADFRRLRVSDPVPVVWDPRLS